MGGESHTLTLSFGSAGDVVMASKPDRLSTKIGRTIGWLIQQGHKPAEPIVSDLKLIHQLALELQRKARASNLDATQEADLVTEFQVLRAEIAEYGKNHHATDIEPDKQNINPLNNDDVNHTALIYKAIVELSNEFYHGDIRGAKLPALEAEKFTQAGTPLNEDPSSQELALQRIQAAYGRACEALPDPQAQSRGTSQVYGNTFRVSGFKFFVDQENDYIIPDSEVKKSGISIQGKKFLAADRSILAKYCYTSSMSMSTLHEIYNSITEKSSQKFSVDQLALALAALVAEPRRNPRAHISNLIAVNNPADFSGKPAFDTLAMTFGGSDPSPREGRTPVLNSYLNEKGYPELDEVANRTLQIVLADKALLAKIDLMILRNREPAMSVIQIKQLIRNRMKTQS